MEIQVLPPEVVDQISAGEVVERPSHMVKELVENSIDAGATDIEVEFAQGGRWVKVKDNGKGIGKEDLAVCLDRHATSKIKKSLDIWNLTTFGFRGEALASISSVCKISVTSRKKDQDTAYQLQCHFGKRQPIEEVGGDQGTVILVEELFENIPARLKFLKSEAAESTAIKNTLKAMAMAHPHVNLRVRQAGKLVYFWGATKSLSERVEQVLERTCMFEGDGDCNGIKSRVVVSSPNETVKNGRQIWLFVQNRWVQDKGLQTAVMDAYRNLLMHKEYPVAAIWVESPTEEVDVNIHPTKSQVKFRNASDAFRAVHRAVRGVVERAPWLEDLLPEAPVKKSSPSEKSHRVVIDSKVEENQSFFDKDLSRVQYAAKSEVTYQAQELTADIFGEPPVTGSDQTYELKNDGIIEDSKKSPYVSENIVDYGKVNLESDFVVKPFAENPKAAEKPEKEGAKSNFWSNLHVIGQADLTYIVAQSEKSIVFVDQHAAHERVAFERLMLAWKDQNIEVQSFLLPLTVTMEEELLEALVVESESLKSMGLDIEKSEDGTLEVLSAPAMIKESALQKALERLAGEIFEKGGSFALDRCVGDIFATMACHSVVRAGQALGMEQMKSLLSQMDEFPLSSFCPHGRPVYVEYPLTKLEKDFGRIV